MGGAPAQIPTSIGHELRAFLRCCLVKTYDQFRDSGCENCPFFKMEEDHERMSMLPSLISTGIIGFGIGLAAMGNLVRVTSMQDFSGKDKKESSTTTTSSLNSYSSSQAVQDSSW